MRVLWFAPTSGFRNPGSCLEADIMKTQPDMWALAEELNAQDEAVEAHAL